MRPDAGCRAVREEEEKDVDDGGRGDDDDDGEDIYSTKITVIVQYFIVYIVTA